jgi:hypothetical protein
VVISKRESPGLKQLLDGTLEERRNAAQYPVNPKRAKRDAEIWDSRAAEMRTAALSRRRGAR